MVRKDPYIRSIFQVVNSPGWVYVEASASERVHKLMKPCVWTRCTTTNILPVDPVEFVRLLTPVRQPGIDVHAWVEIRGGVYHGDIGQVRAVYEEVGELDVAVVPRTVPAAKLKPVKRARMQYQRPIPKRMRREDAIEKFSEKLVKTVGAGYELKGKYHEEAGFRVITVRRNAVQLAKPTLDRITQFIDAAIEKLINDHGDTIGYTDADIWHAGHIDLKTIRIDSLLRVGDEVEIVDGEQQGLKGRIASTATDGKIRVLADTIEGPATLDIEEDVEAVSATFSKGQTVAIRMGTFAGREGIVEDVKNGHAVIRDSRTLQEVSK